MALDPKWDDPIFVDSLPPELRAAYDAETRKLAEQWEREEEEDWMGEPDEFLTPPQKSPPGNTTGDT